MCLKRVKKKLLGHYSKVVKWLFNYFFKKIQKQPPEVFYKEAVLKNFVIFIGRTGKILC